MITSKLRKRFIKPSEVHMNKILTLIPFILIIASCTSTSIQEPKSQTPSEVYSSTLNKLTNPNKPFNVSLQSTNNPVLLGQFLSLSLTSEIGGFANLITISSSGKTFSLLKDKPISANTPMAFPSQNSLVNYEFVPPKGIERYVLIVSSMPLDWFNISDKLYFDHGLTALNMDQTQLEERLKMATSHLDPMQWNVAFLELSLRENKQ